MSNTILYLNKPQTAFFGSTFARMVQESKQEKASVDQWLGIINGFTQKGLKASELDEINFREFLGTLNPKQVLTKAELKAEFLRRQPTIKEVTLAKPQFASYSHTIAGQVAYREILFILNSERANIDDRLEEITYLLEDLDLNPEMAAKNPQLVVQLTDERAQLMQDAGHAYDFTAHHYSSTFSNGNLGRNLLAHARVCLSKDGTWFVQEIQSDWAQRGRTRGFGKGIPAAPFVMDTERWSGLVLRRLIQRAALTKGIKRFVWARGWMRNGYFQDRAQFEAPRGEGVQDTRADKLDDFYVKVLPKTIGKILTQGKTRAGFHEVKTQGGLALEDCVGFEINDELRTIMSNTQPLYSLAGVLKSPAPIDQAKIDFLARHARVMTGVRNIQFLDKVYDIATGKQVAGRTVDKLIQVALNARDVAEAVDHESFHFVHQHLLTPNERLVVKLDFQEGGDLHRRVVDLLVNRGDLAAANQCRDPVECAAHGFALWSKNQFQFERPSYGIFTGVMDVLRDAVRWVNKVCFNQQMQCQEDLFKAIRDGVLAADPVRTRDYRVARDAQEQSDRISDDGSEMAIRPRF